MPAASLLSWREHVLVALPSINAPSMPTLQATDSALTALYPVVVTTSRPIRSGVSRIPGGRLRRVVGDHGRTRVRRFVDQLPVQHVHPTPQGHSPASSLGRSTSVVPKDLGEAFLHGSGNMTRLVQSLLS